MKLVCPFFEDVLNFDEGGFNSLIIENQHIFRNLLQDISHQINGEEGKCILSEKEKPVEMSKYCELISDFVAFDINKKSLVNGIISALGSTAVNESYYMRTNELTAEIERYINDISFDLPCNIECNKLTIQSLIKAMGITICDDYDNDAERIIDYMELVREFDRDRLFITVNMRSYFADDTMQLFCDTAVSHRFRLLMIDNMQYKRLNGEKRLTIDADMCVF